MNAIDTHVHFWKYEKKKFDWIGPSMKELQKDHLPEHIALTLKRNNISGVVAVEAGSTELDTHILVELAGTHPIIQGVVGWVDLTREKIEERLLYFSHYPIIKGWRYVPGSFAPLDFKDPNLKRGMSVLAVFDYSFDLLVQPGQLSEAGNFISLFPGQPFILDHCGKPDIKNKRLEEWRSGIRDIANNPNLYCKLSGLFTEAKWKEWSAGEFYPYFDVVFEAFGVDRLLFGSDWPVMLLSGMYVQWKSLLEKYMENYKEEDREKVFFLNAERVYRLRVVNSEL